MDDQHKVLVKMLNDLHAAMIAGQAKSVAGDLLKRLLRYTREHFAAEESLLRHTQYPQLAAHCAQHRHLTGEVDKYIRRYESGEVALSIELLTFLRDWLTTHIQKTDREYGTWLNARGVK